MEVVQRLVQLGMLRTAWESDFPGKAHCARLAEAVAIADLEHKQLKAASHEQQQQQQQQEEEGNAEVLQFPEQQQALSGSHDVAPFDEPLLSDVVPAGFSALLEDRPVVWTD